MNRRVNGTLVVAVLLSSVSCQTSQSVAPAAPVEAKSSIVSMAMASSIDARGQLVNPRFTFSPSERQITALVRVGKTNASTLTVTWYLKSHDSDTKLFEHQIQIRNNDRAFSIGRSPGAFLLAGSYRVVATLGGETKTLRFDVAQARTAPNNVSSRWDNESFSVRPVGLLRQVAWLSAAQTTPSPQTGSSTGQGQPPVSGECGTMAGDGGTTAFAEFPEDCGVSFTAEYNPPSGYVDLHADALDIDSDGKCVGTTHIDVCATVNGPRKRVGTYYTTAGRGNYTSAHFFVDPCWLPGGSDLPGTKVIVSGDFGGLMGTLNAVSHDITISLGEDTLAPTVTIVPRAGEVKEGDTISLKVTAKEERGRGPWQSGVKMIQVTVGHGDLVKEPWLNHADRASQKCAEKTWEHTYDAAYVVPSNPPPVINLCALAEDYAGNPGYDCAQFTTITANQLVWHGRIEDERASVDRALSGGGVPRMPTPFTYAHAIGVTFDYVQQVRADGSVWWPKRHLDWTLEGAMGDDTFTETCRGQGSLDLAAANDAGTLTDGEQANLQAHCERDQSAVSFRLYGSLPHEPPLPKIPGVAALDENCAYREEVGSRRTSIWLTPCTRKSQPGR